MAVGLQELLQTKRVSSCEAQGQEPESEAFSELTAVRRERRLPRGRASADSREGPRKVGLGEARGHRGAYCSAVPLQPAEENLLRGIPELPRRGGPSGGAVSLKERARHVQKAGPGGGAAAGPIPQPRSRPPTRG